MTETADQRVADTIIIGAGPAGLAVAACLTRAGVSSVILEQSEHVASTWHDHYERLHLHTAKAFSALPYMPFPKEFPRYPSRLQVISYLDDYARRFKLQPRFGQRVRAARRVNAPWTVETQDSRHTAPHLVVATGYNREPYLPEWPGQRTFRGTIIHSSEYRNGAPFKGQRVLVVGFGNSGGEIAIDLWEHGAKPGIAVRSPVNVLPRELFGIPVGAIGILQRHLPPRLVDAINGPLVRAIRGDLTRYGLRRAPHGPLTQIQRQARIPLIDVGTIKLIKQGELTVFPGIERFTEDGVTFTDGRHEPFDAIVLATGYRAQVGEFLDGASAVCDDKGTPSVSGGPTAVAGLFFCGFRVTPTGVLREISLEARRIASAIARDRPAHASESAREGGSRRIGQ